MNQLFALLSTHQVAQMNAVRIFIELREEQQAQPGADIIITTTETVEA